MVLYIANSYARPSFVLLRSIYEEYGRLVGWLPDFDSKCVDAATGSIHLLPVAFKNVGLRFTVVLARQGLFRLYIHTNFSVGNSSAAVRQGARVPSDIFG